jgi:hypothetical protein
MDFGSEAIVLICVLGFVQISILCQEKIKKKKKIEDLGWQQDRLFCISENENIISLIQKCFFLKFCL